MRRGDVSASATQGNSERETARYHPSYFLPTSSQQITFLLFPKLSCIQHTTFTGEETNRKPNNLRSGKGSIVAVKRCTSTYIVPNGSFYSTKDVIMMRLQAGPVTRGQKELLKG